MEIINKKITIDNVLNKAKKKTKLTPEGEELIKKAFVFASRWHDSQKRLTGEPYITHPLAVAMYLAGLKMDANTISAGLLHDVAEDTDCTIEDIKKEFSDEIARIVEGVTRLGGVKYFGKRGRVEDLRKLLLIMAKDLRVVIVKLCDRLHNMQTIYALPPSKRKKIASETIEIYAPLASRLGMGEMKGALEDLSFKYYLPKEFKRVSLLVDEKEGEREKYIKRIKEHLNKKLNKVGIKATIEGRAKHLYSLYKKLLKNNDDFSKIYDLMAIRVIVDTVSDCYKVLGIIHQEWKPLIKRIKDYIAVPKPNGYRSIHTTVFALDGRITEIQVKTKKMHEDAEWGIAGHWHYEIEKESKVIDRQLSWIKQLSEWQKDLEASAFMEGLKVDVLKDRIFIFTPQGEALDLPEGATPIDFAYSIHTQVGSSCIGCKVNGKIVPLNHSLRNGDVVEILTSKKILGPSKDWLRYAKTSLALSSIRRWFKDEDREENLSLGKELLKDELKKIGRSVDKIKEKELSDYIKENKSPYKDLENILVAIGQGALNPKQVSSGLYLSDEKIDVKKDGLLTRIFPFLRSEPQIKPRVKVYGEKDFLINFASCCNPSSHHKIVGFVTRGRGVTIHKKNCPNIKRGDLKRFIDAEWDIEKIHDVPIYIESSNGSNLLKDLTQLLSEQEIETKNINLKSGKISKITATLEIRKSKELKDILEKISNLPEVKLVKRL